MTKEEKRHIRMQVIQMLDQHCQQCEYYSKLNSCMSVCRQCPYGQRMQELTRPLWEGCDTDPYFRSTKAGRWSREEDFYLIHHYDVLPIEALSARLGRTAESIEKRIAELKGGEPA